MTHEILRMVLPLSPSGNQTRKMHHMQLHRWRQKMTVIARVECLEKCTYPEKRYVTITRHSTRTLDHDNFVWGCKQIVDALANARVIWDDDPNHVAVEYKQVKAPNKRSQKTVVEVGHG